MTKLKAGPADGETGQDRGMMTMVCPVCGNEVKERDLMICDEESTENSIELCLPCSEEFEFDYEMTIDSDVLPHAVFEKLWAFAKSGTDELKPQVQS